MRQDKTTMYFYISLILLLLITAITPTHAFNLSQKLYECQTHFKADRLTTGRGGTALACYEEVLKKDPTNSKAWQGLDKIKARYSFLINRALNRGQQYKIQAYLKALDFVDDLKTRLQEPLIEQTRQNTNQERRDITQKFKDYPVNKIYKGKNHPLLLDSSFAYSFRTRLRNAIKYDKPDFAGRYIITGWGCGTNGCNSGAVIDATTGRVYPFPVFATTSVHPLKPEFSEEWGQNTIYRLDSRLMILAGNLDDTMDVIKFYEFKDNKFIYIKSVPYGRSARSRSELFFEAKQNIGGRERFGQTSKLPSPPTVEQPKVFPQLGHSDSVLSVAFSPDGKRALSASSDNTLKLWDISSEYLIRTFKGHSDSILSVAFSPDGKRALSGSLDNTLKLWDLSSGQLLKTFEEHSDSILSVAFSPDGKRALSGSKDGIVKLWDVSSGQLLKTFEGDSGTIYSVAFSPDGKLVLSSENSRVKLWDVLSGQLLKTFEEYSGNVAFSTDGKRVLSSENSTVKLWDVSSGQLLKMFEGHSSTIHSVAFSPNGKLALSASADHTLILWDISSGKLLKMFEGHSNSVHSVTFSHDGKWVLSGSSDHTLKLWNLSSGQLSKIFKGNSYPIHSVAFSPDGKRVLSGSSDHTLKLWNLSSGQFLKTFKGHSNTIYSVAFSPDGKRALSSSKDATVRLWDVSSGQLLKTFKDFYHPVYSVAFSPNGKWALSGEEFAGLKLWDISSGQLLKKFNSNSEHSVAFSPDGKLVLSGSEFFGELEMWDVLSGQLLKTFQRRNSTPVHSVAFSPDGKRALSGNRDNTLKMFDVSSGKLLKVFEGHSSSVQSIAFSPDGKLALSGSWDNTLKLWDLSSGQLLKTFEGHSDSVGSVAFSPDGKWILSGSWDTTMRLWDVKTGKEITQMLFFEDGEWITITPEGYYQASLNGAKYLNVRIGNQVYGIDQYEAIYHRPDIVKLAIELGDSQQAIAQLSHGAAPVQIAQVQPPKVWFVTPKDGYKTHRANVEVQVKTENVADKADAVSFFLNQRPVATLKGKRTRPTAAGAEVKLYTQTISLLEGYNRIQAEVRGKAGAVQRTPLLSVVRKGEDKKWPDLYYLGIGVAEHPQVPLRFPAKDVTGLETVLKQLQGKVYRRVVTKTLTNQQATRGNLINAISTFFEPAKRGDIAILFVSGHGMNTRMGYHFVTYDANVDQLAATGASWQIFNAINKLKAHVLLFADTCHAGNITGNSKWKDQSQADPNQFLRDANLHNVVVLASSSGGDYSIENPQWGHGAFTKALIDGLSGEAAYKKGVVKLSFLQDYVRDTVRELTDNAQTPTIPKVSGSGEFFELVLARE